MAEQLTVYGPGERFATVARDGKASVYEVTEDGRAYICGFMPDENGEQDNG